MDYNNDEHKRKPSIGPIIAVIVTTLGTIIVAYIQFVLSPKLSAQATQTAEANQFVTVSLATPTIDATVNPPSTYPPTAQVEVGRLVGVLTDREGTPISDLTISILNGPATRTDVKGSFVLNNVAKGDQIIVVKPPSGDGQFTLNFTVTPDQTNNVNIVYDAATSRLGLLSIVSPVDEGELEVQRVSVEENGTMINVHYATVSGRCDGLEQIFTNGFDIWVFLGSEKDRLIWKQDTAPICDPHDNTWKVRVVLGNKDHPPENGEIWRILAIATSPDSGFDDITNTSKESSLPPHITSNVVFVETQIK